MTPDLFIASGITPALSLLPSWMDTPSARAMMLAVPLQESKLASRWQKGSGTARGYPQFERAGIRGVLTHRASRPHAVALCAALDVPATVEAAIRAIEFNDVLAAGFTRTLFLTIPEPLPERDQPDEGWSQYLATWRPGKPHPETWHAHYAEAWARVTAQES